MLKLLDKKPNTNVFFFIWILKSINIVAWVSIIWGITKSKKKKKKKNVSMKWSNLEVRKLHLCQIIYLHNDVVNGNVDKFHEKSNESHNTKANCGSNSNFLEL